MGEGKDKQGVNGEGCGVAHHRKQAILKPTSQWQCTPTLKPGGIHEAELFNKGQTLKGDHTRQLFYF